MFLYLLNINIMVFLFWNFVNNRLKKDVNVVKIFILG